MPKFLYTDPELGKRITVEAESQEEANQKYLATRRALMGESGAEDAAAPQAQAGEQPSFAAGALRETFQGLTLGGADEIEGFIRSIWNGTATDDEIAKVRASVKQFAQANPIASGAFRFAGGLASMLIPGGAIVRGANLGQKALRGAILGGTEGAIGGFLGAEGGFENRARGAGEGAKIGTLFGLGAPLAIGGIARARGKRLGPIERTPEFHTTDTLPAGFYVTPSGSIADALAGGRFARVPQNVQRNLSEFPDLDELNERAAAMYRSIDAVGTGSRAVRLTPLAARRAINRAREIAQRGGELEIEALDRFSRIVERDGGLRFGQLARLRADIRHEVKRSGRPQDMMIAHEVIEELDRLGKNPSLNDLITPPSWSVARTINTDTGTLNMTRAARMRILKDRLNEASLTYSRAQKTEVIQDIIEGAENATQETGKALRAGFNRLQKSKLINSFNAAEREVIAQAAKGTLTERGFNAISANVGINFRTAMAALFGSVILGGTPGFLGAVTGAGAANILQKRLARKHAGRARDVVAAGGRTPPRPALGTGRERLRVGVGLSAGRLAVSESERQRREGR